MTDTTAINAKQADMFAKMDMCEQSLTNATKRYRTPCKSTFGVCSRYDLQAKALKDAGYWNEWCKRKDVCITHTAIDYFA